MKSAIAFRLNIAALLLCALHGGGAAAQNVHKCVVGGHTVYQTDPCQAGGKELNVSAVSTPEQQRAAQKSRFDEIQRQHETQTEADSARRKEMYEKARNNAPVAKAAPDCAALNKKLGDAYGERNGMLSFNKGRMDGGSTAAINDKNMGEINSNINSTTQALNEAGCKIN